MRPIVSSCHSGPAVRRHVSTCSSANYNRPTRPPSRPTSPPRPPRQGQTSGGPKLTLQTAVSQLQQLWQQVPLVAVGKDPSTRLLTKPPQPGRLGTPVRLLTNHFGIALSQGSLAARTYTVSITRKGATEAQTGGKGQKGAAAASIPLDVRQQVVSEIAKTQSWTADSWQYDPSSNRLFSLVQLTTGAVDVQLAGVVGQKGRKPSSTPGSDDYEVTISQPQSSTQLFPADPSTLDLLGMLLKASFIAALPKQAIQSARSFLLGPAQQPAGTPAAAGGRGGGRGRDGGGRGRSGGGGRGGAGPAAAGAGALQFWEGIRSGVKLSDSSQPGSVRLDVQLDRTAGGVIPAGPLAKLVLVPGAASPADLAGNKRLCKDAENLVNGLKIQVAYNGTQSRKVRGLDPRTPQQYTFKADGGRETTVAEYFRRTYPNLQLKHLQDWPCVMVSKTAAIPLELCSVVAPQARKALTDRQTADLIRLAALPPQRRLDSLKQIVASQLSGFQLPLLNKWGIKVSTNPVEVLGRILPDARLQYANSTCVDAANKGQWRPDRQSTFLQPANLQRWAVLNLAGASLDSGVSDFVSALRSQLQQQGGAASIPRTVAGNPSAIAAAVRQAANVAAAGGRAADAQLLLVVLPNDKGQAYKEVKKAAAELGIVTQCMVASKAGILPNPRGINMPYVGNILLKINKKAGGTNWQLPQGPEAWAPKLGTKQLLVLGIDVTHGMAVGSSSKPSTAAVVGSLDRGCSRFGAVVMEQTAGEEIVLGLRDAVDQLLRDRFTAVAGRDQGSRSADELLPAAGLPECVLVYRDGVSDSQYLAVLQEEVAAIRQACADVGGPSYKPKLTFVVVSKSHGTRLFPHPQDPNSSDASIGGRSGNVVPGTAVDTLITAPLKYEFYLNSHAGIQGTNRPGRYNVLVDDVGLGPDGLQLLTQHLASIYCACTRTISCPAPARYADKAAGVAAASSGQAGSWQVVQAAAPGVKAREYRMLNISTDMAGKMWFA